MLELKFDAKKQLKIRLRAQSPMIHFQACDGGPSGVKVTESETIGHIGGGLSGVTLRASEVRPKLDKYIFRRIAGIAPGEELSGDHLLKVKKDLLKREEYQDIFSDPDKTDYALKYKMSIQVDKDELVRIVKLEKDPPENMPLEKRKKYYSSAYMPFFANSNKTPRMKGVLCDPVLTITCFNEHVRSLIVKYLKDFFFVTNFGTRQGKGFGSFVLEGSEREEASVVQALMENYGAKACYRMQVKNPPTELYFSDYFNYIGYFSQFMKSGRNDPGKRNKRENKNLYYVRGFIFQYMHSQGIGNEKKWMKKNNISPTYYTNHSTVNKEENEGEYRFVRAMLGTQNSIRYKEAEKKFTKIYIADVTRGNDKFERVPSPVFYKIIGNDIYIIAGRVPKRLFNHKFIFRGYHSESLATPDAFDIDDFIKKYVEFYNDKSDENAPRQQFFKEMKSAPMVEETSYEKSSID